MNIFTQTLDWNLERLREIKFFLTNQQWKEIGLEHILSASLLLLIIFIVSYLVIRVFESLVKLGIAILIIWTLYLLIFKRDIFRNLSQSFLKETNNSNEIKEVMKKNDFKNYKKEFIKFSGVDKKISEEIIAQWKKIGIPANKAGKAWKNGWEPKKEEVRLNIFNGDIEGSLNSKDWLYDVEIYVKPSKKNKII